MKAKSNAVTWQPLAVVVPSDCKGTCGFRVRASSLFPGSVIFLFLKPAPYPGIFFRPATSKPMHSNVFCLFLCSRICVFVHTQVRHREMENSKLRGCKSLVREISLCHQSDIAAVTLSSDNANSGLISDRLLPSSFCQIYVLILCLVCEQRQGHQNARKQKKKPNTSLRNKGCHGDFEFP